MGLLPEAAQSLQTRVRVSEVKRRGAETLSESVASRIEASDNQKLQILDLHVHQRFPDSGEEAQPPPRSQTKASSRKKIEGVKGQRDA